MDLQHLLNKRKTQIMGVINLTPDSFSDGSVNLNSSKLLHNFTSLSKHCDILDVGAESTAPFNDAISSIDELKRFETYFFPLVESLRDPGKTISIDTYKPEVFYEVAIVINKFWPKSKIIFNDISGQVDSELRYLLKDSLKFDYILCHNLAPSRFMASDHMNYLSDNIIESVTSFFKEHQDILSSKRAIHADPCFGFSKTYAQNHELLKNLHKIDSLKSYQSTIIGLSKKSFLRMPKSLKLAENLTEIEQIHSNVLCQLLNKMNSRITIRTHDVSPVKSALKTSELLG